MSRSYRQPYITCGYGTKTRKIEKNQANRRVRHTKNIPNGKKYRRFYNPWDIRDFSFYYNPHPRIYYYNGVVKIVEPDPIYKWNRK